MPWDWVVGQHRAVDALRRAVGGDRVPHAFLFHGPEGVGKRVAALALAQALQCERRQPGQDDACGQCTPCSKVARMLHPDVQVFLALPSTHQDRPKQAHFEDIAARLQALGEDPYAEVSYTRRPDLSDPEKSANLRPFYSVDRVREISRTLHFTPAEGRAKVAVLTDADTMNASAANAFLKTLEEPTPRTTLVLTASRVDTLLPTIVSRCQRLRFDPLAPADIEAALIARGTADATRAALLARMADGSLTRALSLADSPDLAERREQVLRFLRLAYKPFSPPLDDVLQTLAKLGREPLRDALHLMLAWIRDFHLMRAIGPEAPIVNVDQREAVENFVRNVGEARLADMVALVEHALSLLAGNVNTNLVLTVLADGLREAMNGTARERLFEPLAQ